MVISCFSICSSPSSPQDTSKFKVIHSSFFGWCNPGFSTLCRYIEESGELWCFQHYQLVHEYYNKPPLPPPTNFIYELFVIFRVVWRRIFKTEINGNSRFSMYNASVLEMAFWSLFRPGPLGLNVGPNLARAATNLPAIIFYALFTLAL